MDNSRGGKMAHAPSVPGTTGSRGSGMRPVCQVQRGAGEGGERRGSERATQTYYKGTPSVLKPKNSSNSGKKNGTRAPANQEKATFLHVSTPRPQTKSAMNEILKAQPNGPLAR